MTKFKTTLLKIVGRIKTMLADMFIQYGAMGMPLGFAIMFASYELFEGWLMRLCVGVGVVVVVAGYYSFSYAIKLRKREQAESDAQNEKLFNALITEIRGLRKDLTRRKGKDGL
ncbi:hypothetical protein ACFLUD_02475 [Chloroflexota bacterium]